jgi:peptidyl carrier protein
MAELTLTDRLVSFIQGLVAEDRHIEIDEQTPLLEVGVLDSLKTAVLLNFIYNELHAKIPAGKLSTQNFKDVRSIVSAIEADQLAPADSRAGAR